MFRVWECYHPQGHPPYTTQALGDFDELEQAQSFAEASYRQLAAIPESERMSVRVINSNGRVLHTVPAEG